MVFWFAILGGALFTWLAVQRGFFEIWGLTFNCIISIYVAIFLAPDVALYASTTGTASPYAMALSMLVLAGGCFAVLYGLSYVFLIGQFRVSFPEVIDILLAGATGFLAGFLVFSFASIIIATAPLPRHRWLKSVGLTPDAQGSATAGIAWCCDRIHSIVGLGESETPTRDAIERLLREPEKLKSPHRRPAPPETDANAPPAPAVPE